MEQRQQAVCWDVCLNKNNMAEVLNFQIDLFLLSLLWGALIGIVYDGFRCLRILVTHNVIMTAIEDIIFWLITAGMIFYLLYQYNYGSLRSYAFLGVFLGFIIYYMSISQLLLAVFKLFAAKLKWLFGKEKAILAKLFKSLKNMLKKVYKTVKIASKNR